MEEARRCLHTYRRHPEGAPFWARVSKDGRGRLWPILRGSPLRGERLRMTGVRGDEGYVAPAFCAYSHDAFDSGTVRLADSIAFALAAVPSRMRPAMPCVMPASRNKL
jgi:hypothetical protein